MKLRTFTRFVFLIALSIVTVTQADNLIVSDYVGNSVSTLGTDGSAHLFASGTQTPEGIVMDASGNIYVALQQSQTIEKFTPTHVASTFATLDGWIQGLAIDSQGNIYACNATQRTVDKITPGGTVSVFASGFGAFSLPEAVAFDNSGNLYCTDYNAGTVDRISSTGIVTSYISSLSNPAGLVFDPSGNLYVAEHSQNAVLKIVPGGAESLFGGTIQSPFGVAFGSDSNLYVNSDVGWVYQITPDGTTTKFATGFQQLSFIATIPEPGAMLIACAGLSILARRRDRTARAIQN